MQGKQDREEKRKYSFDDAEYGRLRSSRGHLCLILFIVCNKTFLR
jgi:hypothetical protein